MRLSRRSPRKHKVLATVLATGAAVTGFAQAATFWITDGGKVPASSWNPIPNGCGLDEVTRAIREAGPHGPISIHWDRLGPTVDIAGLPVNDELKGTLAAARDEQVGG